MNAVSPALTGLFEWLTTLLAVLTSSARQMDVPGLIVCFLFASALPILIARRQTSSLRGSAISGMALISLGCLGLLALLGHFRSYAGYDLLLSRISPLTTIVSLALGCILCFVFGRRQRFARQPMRITITVLGLIGLLFVLAGVDYAVIRDGETMLRSRVAWLKDTQI